jgi:hypothetical protein
MVANFRKPAVLVLLFAIGSFGLQRKKMRDNIF